MKNDYITKIQVTNTILNIAVALLAIVSLIFGFCIKTEEFLDYQILGLICIFLAIVLIYRKEQTNQYIGTVMYGAGCNVVSEYFGYPTVDYRVERTLSNINIIMSYEVHETLNAKDLLNLATIAYAGFSAVDYARLSTVGYGFVATYEDNKKAQNYLRDYIRLTHDNSITEMQEEDMMRDEITKLSKICKRNARAILKSNREQLNAKACALHTMHVIKG